MDLVSFKSLFSLSSSKFCKNLLSIFTPSFSIFAKVKMKGFSTFLAKSSIIGSSFKISSLYNFNVISASSAAYLVASSKSTFAKLSPFLIVLLNGIISWLKNLLARASSPTGLPGSKSQAKIIVSAYGIGGVNPKLFKITLKSNLIFCPTTLFL